ncbi:uncharacterized protein [Miscanthus floridulus]|uniref:uncharacterized protein n=1 Tax=Miscanthus floridulus TaxID=154761 RepID=UPI0034596105
MPVCARAVALRCGRQPLDFGRLLERETVFGASSVPEAAHGSAQHPHATSDVDASKAKEATPMMAEEQLAPLAATSVVVGATVQPQSPPVVPQVTVEEDEVEEIKHAEPKPQSIRILQKCGEEVVVVKEENTAREIKRLKSTVVGEKSIKRAQRERDLAESNSWDLEHQKGVLSEQLMATSEQLKKKSEQLVIVSEELKNMSEQLGKKTEELKSKSEQLDRKCQQFEDASKQKSEQDAELDQLRQNFEQIRRDKAKESDRANKLAEELKGKYPLSIRGGFANGLSDAQTQQLEDDVEDVAKMLVDDIDLFGETEAVGEA